MRWPWQPRPDPLGEGVWWRAHARFDRAVDRYHQMIARVPAGPARDDLERVGTDLVGTLAQVHAVCLAGQQQCPSAGLDVPPGAWGAAHRGVSAAAGLVARAAEAAAMVSVGTDPDRTVAAARAAARRAADRVGAAAEQAGVPAVRGSAAGRSRPAR